MSDERTFETPAEQAGRTEQRIADLEALVNARLGRLPTGLMVRYAGTSPPAHALFCHGQAVSRTEYAGLFQWATEQGAIGPGLLFGVGDGSTTFTVPDDRDKFHTGAGGSLSPGATGGQASRALTTTELPAHAHTATTTVPSHAAHDHTFTGGGATTSNAGDHGHSGSTNNAGAHGGHVAGGGSPNATGAAQSNYTTVYGDHTHSVNINNAGGHTHSVTLNGDVGQAGAMSHTPSTTVNSAGSGAAFDQRPPYIALQTIIYT